MSWPNMSKAPQYGVDIWKILIHDTTDSPPILFLSAVTTSVLQVTRTVNDEEMAVFGMNAM